MTDTFVLFGGSGFVGRAVADELLSAGRDVTVVDRRPPPDGLLARGAHWLAADVLTDELPPLPPGPAAILLGSSHPRPCWPWTLPVSNAVATARILPALAGRPVVLLSSIEVYGSAPAPLREDTAPRLPWTIGQIDQWCDQAVEIAAAPCPPWQAAPAGRALAAADPTGRWTYALSKLAQERLVQRGCGAERVTILRLANVYGIGQERFMSRLTRRALAGLPLPVTEVTRTFVPVGDVAEIVAGDLSPGVYNVGGEPAALPDVAAEIRDLCGSDSPLVLQLPPADDSCGVVDSGKLAAAGHPIMPVSPGLKELVESLQADPRPVADPAIPVVRPSRAARPDEVGARMQASLWTGATKHGNRWSRELTGGLAAELELGAEHTVLVTESGTAALRLAVAATAGPAAPGDAAILPSFTFPATAEVLLQLGYRLRFVDVTDDTWTLDPAGVRRELAAGGVRLVVCVDTFGQPCDYAALRQVCGEAGIPLVGDSAASLGSRYRGSPVATQAGAHAYSMSFAKVLSAGGAGGAVVMPAAAAAALHADPAGWTRSVLMDELHAIYALDQLTVLADLVRRRNLIAGIYADAVAAIGGLQAQRLQPGDAHSFVHWVMRVRRSPGRDELARALAECGVQTKPYFRALHLAVPGRGERLPVTERLDAEVLALPMSSELTSDDAEQVVMAVQHVLAGR